MPVTGTGSIHGLFVRGRIHRWTKKRSHCKTGNARKLSAFFLLTGAN
jgi:hypothetical protein